MHPLCADMGRRAATCSSRPRDSRIPTNYKKVFTKKGFWLLLWIFNKKCCCTLLIFKWHCSYFLINIGLFSVVYCSILSEILNIINNISLWGTYDSRKQISDDCKAHCDSLPFLDINPPKCRKQIVLEIQPFGKYWTWYLWSTDPSSW